MYEKTDKIWMNGSFVDWDDAKVHVLTHTLHYGVGVFEGIRYYAGEKGSAAFRLKEHMRRFEESCRIVAMKLPYSTNELIEACLETVKKNGLKDGYIRPLAYISEGPGVGLWAYDNDIRVMIATWGWGAYLGAEGLANGIRAATSSFMRHHPNIAMTKGKVTGHYFNSVLAKREAKMTGFDEAIMLDQDGQVAEGTGENIFIVRDGRVRTPPLGSILPGITRNSIMTMLDDEKIPLSVGHISRDDLYVADEVFLTGTAAEVTPIREIDSRQVGDGKPGPITKKMQSMYSDAVRGKISKYSEWLAPIEM